MQNRKPLASIYSWARQFESYLVANPENRFSHDVAHLSIYHYCKDIERFWSYTQKTLL